MPSQAPTHGSLRGVSMKATGFGTAGGATAMSGRVGSATGTGGSVSSTVTGGLSSGALAKGTSRARSGPGGSAGRGVAPARASHSASRPSARVLRTYPPFFGAGFCVGAGAGLARRAFIAFARSRAQSRSVVSGLLLTTDS